jgi:hypothetical protein
LSTSTPPTHSDATSKALHAFRSKFSEFDAPPPRRRRAATDPSPSEASNNQRWLAFSRFIRRREVANAAEAVLSSLAQPSDDDDDGAAPAKSRELLASFMCARFPAETLNSYVPTYVVRL